MLQALLASTILFAIRLPLRTDVAPNRRRVVQIIRPDDGVNEEYQAGNASPNHIGTSARVPRLDVP